VAASSRFSSGLPTLHDEGSGPVSGGRKSIDIPVARGAATVEGRAVTGQQFRAIGCKRDHRRSGDPQAPVYQGQGRCSSDAVIPDGPTVGGGGGGGSPGG
jgi:hypothetical protein